MKTRLASLFLLLVLFGSAFAGVSLNFSESHCSMGGGVDMDCCKAALAQKDKAKFTREGELLCALNCAQNGTTLPANTVRVTPPPQTIQPAPPSLTAPLSNPLTQSKLSTRAHDPTGSPPTYLRNLALLI